MRATDKVSEAMKQSKSDAVPTQEKPHIRQPPKKSLGKTD